MVDGADADGVVADGEVAAGEVAAGDVAAGVVPERPGASPDWPGGLGCRCSGWAAVAAIDTAPTINEVSATAAMACRHREMLTAKTLPSGQMRCATASAVAVT